MKINWINVISVISFCFTYFLVSSFFITNVQKEEQANSFSTYFPDKNLAILVAERLGKNVDEKVTTKELASIKGDFVVGPGEASSLTGIGFLVGIDSFGCYKNNVKIIPSEIGKLENLLLLDLCKAFEVEKIPSEIGNLKKLKKIRLSLTEVSSIPKEIGNLNQLEILWICCNHLTEIPKEIGSLRNLVDLDIHSNNISYLPDEICRLTKLKSLNLSYCELKKIPENIGDLNKLKTLNLFNNDLRYLPKSIVNLVNLKELNIYDNFKLNENYKQYLPKSLKKR